jgi:glycosyltransferase involved in cell wall biosynthesis
MTKIKMEKITIITPVFNGERYLDETIKSVLATTKDIDFEYFVIDDGSTDSTAAIAAEYGDAIRYIYKKNGGQPSAVNLGISLAKGKYGIIVNSDDPLLSGELFTESLKIFQNIAQCVVTYPDWQIIDSEGKALREIKQKDYSLDEMVGNYNCLVGPGGIFRLSVAKEIGGWDESYRFVPDFDFWLRLSDYGDFVRIPKNLAQWRTHRESISVGSRGLEMSRERIRVINTYLNRREVDAKLRSRAISSAMYSASKLSIFDGAVSGYKLLLAAFQEDKTILLRRSFAHTIAILLNPLVRFTHRKLIALNIELKGLRRNGL